MTWKKKRRIQGKYEHYSLSKKLKSEHKTSEQFEIMLNSLTIEELLGLKIELACKAAGQPILGLPLWYSMPTVARHAILLYAASAARSDREAAKLLGITRMEFKMNCLEYNILTYFSKERKEQNDNKPENERKYNFGNPHKRRNDYEEPEPTDNTN